MLSLKMIALARLMLVDVNIAATTAMQAIHPQGREQALLAGANVVMPQVTQRKYRPDYLIYEGKPCTGDETDQCRNCLTQRLHNIGKSVAWRKRGDPLHYFARTKKNGC